MRAPWLWLLGAACSSDQTITIRGYVGYSPLGGYISEGTVAIRDADGLSFDKADLSMDGFKVKAPVQQRIYAEIEAPDAAMASFTGATGTENMTLTDNELFSFPVSQLNELREEFAGCAGVDSDGGVVLGITVFDGINESDTGDPAKVTNATAMVTTADGTEFRACYRDAEGTAYDPEADATGNSGFFAIFGVPSGLQTLTVTYQPAPGESALTYADLYVPTGPDAVIPRYPQWIESPF